MIFHFTITNINIIKIHRFIIFPAKLTQATCVPKYCVKNKTNWLNNV